MSEKENLILIKKKFHTYIYTKFMLSAYLYAN